MFLYIAAAECKRVSTAANDWENIRILIDYNYINGTKEDPQLCKRFGSGAGSSVWEMREACFQFIQDYQTIIPALQGTLENAKDYVQRLVLVHPRDKDIYAKTADIGHDPKFGIQTFKAAPFTTGSQQIQFPGIHLYIAVLFRPFISPKYSPTIAYITQNDYFGTHRPLTGNIIASMDKRKYYTDSATLRVEDENTPNNFLFWECVKDIITILGVQKDQFQNFHPQNSETVYSDPICTIRTSYKTYKFLVTPYAHKFAKRHFGVETFTIDGNSCPAGIELDEGSNTLYGNLESRTLYGDVMSNVYAGYLYPRVTDATAAVLLDTGNYEINWSMVQPHEWGHRDSINGEYIENFGTAMQQYVYPRYYQMDSSSPEAEKEKVTGFNFKYVGALDDWEQSTSSRKRPFNPKNWKYVSKLEVADYAVIKPVKKYCPPYQAILPSEGGPYDFIARGLFNDGKAWKVYQCGEYDCRTYNEFKYRLYNNSQRTQYVDIICNNDNANVKFTHTVDDTTLTMWCPEPERFCRSMNLNHAYFKSNPFDENADQEDLLPLPTTIPPTVAPSPEPTLEPTPDPTPSAWPTERPPELWTDQPEEWFIPKKTRTPVPPETPEPTEHPEQTDYPTHYRTPDQTEFVLPTIPNYDSVVAAAKEAAKLAASKEGTYDGSTTLIVIGVLCMIVIIDIAVVLNVYFIFRKVEYEDLQQEQGLEQTDFHV